MRYDTNELFVYNSHFCMITYNSVLHLDILSRGAIMTCRRIWRGNGLICYEYLISY